MPALDDKAVNTLSKLVVSAVRQVLSAYPLPVLLTGQITAVSDKQYTVSVHGREYAVPLKGTPSFAAGETVTLLAEQNNFQHMVILS